MTASRCPGIAHCRREAGGRQIQVISTELGEWFMGGIFVAGSGHQSKI
jgi:hypothetical protein